jgi:patatin-like phospholipase/acyl hydrolase
MKNVESQPSTGKTFKILSIDGGGIRGIFPAAYLNYLVQKLGDPRQIRSHFDLLAGTSTGGIIVLALALDLPLAKILDLYRNASHKIFRKSLSSIFCGIIAPKYDSEDLIGELKQAFGEMKLKDSKSFLCIPSVDVLTGKPRVFKTPHSKEFVNDLNLFAWQVAAATSAAPGYFTPYHDETIGMHVDGGLWGNNPSLIGIAEAIRLGYKPHEIKILSIGTGSKPIYRNRLLLKHFGLAGWGLKLIDLTFQTQSQAASNISNYLCGPNYKRIDVVLPHSKYALDNVKNANELEHLATQKAMETYVEIQNQFFNGDN